MKRVFRFGEETTCQECGCETSTVYILAESRKEAEERFGEGDYVCGECMAETIAGSGLPVGVGRCFPSTTCIPNFFDREHFEEILPTLAYRSDRFVEELADRVAEELADEVSRLFYEHMDRHGEEYLKETTGNPNERTLLAIKVGKYVVIAIGDDTLTWLDIKALTPDGDEISINNLNFVLSEVVEPAIEDWEERKEIVEGTCIVGNDSEISNVLENLRELEDDRDFEKAIEEDIRDGGL